MKIEYSECIGCFGVIDYSKDLDVDDLCVKHHNEYHVYLHNKCADIGFKLNEKIWPENKKIKGE